MEPNIKSCMLVVRNWASEKVATGQEPPWAWYQYMKLIDAVDSIRRGRASVMRLGAGLQEPAQAPAAQQSGERKEPAAPTSTEQSPDDETGPPPLPM
jgi:hypothetical protein